MSSANLASALASSDPGEAAPSPASFEPESAATLGSKASRANANSDSERGPDAACQGSDVAAERLALHAGTIDWVGMQGIDMPIRFDGGDGAIQSCRARVDAFVNLNRPDRRGIHMSRLYVLANRHFGMHPVNARTLESLLRAFLESHRDLADCARICIHFEHIVRRKALRSHHHGWRAYPVSIEATLIDGVFQLELATQVVYSSTCPASAALSRQLIQEQFVRDFGTDVALDPATVHAWLGSERGIVATPHAQRSIAHVRVWLASGAALDLIALLDQVEQSLRTAVQTAVKREDEQAFAQINGENPMFCEDAIRRIQRALDSNRDVAGFRVRVEHQESLHPHDAVAQVSRNLPVHAFAIGTDHGLPD